MCTRWFCFGLGSAFIFAVAIFPLIHKPFIRGDVEIFFRALDSAFRDMPIYFTPNGSENTKPPFAALLFLPFFWLPRWAFTCAWDLVNVVALPWLVVRFADRRRPFWIAFASIFFVLGPWVRELAYGQYNVLTLFAMYGAASASSIVAAPLVAASLVLKPTNVVLLPWVLFGRSAGSQRAFLLQLGIAGGVMAATYALVFGPNALWEHHAQYLFFAPQMHAANIGRLENFGFLRLVVQWFPALGPGSAYAFLVATLLSVWVCRRCANRREAFALCCLILLIFSPMVWFQNYVLLLPVVVLLLEQASLPGAERAWAVAGLAAIYLGTQVYNPTLLGREAFDALRVCSPPLVATAVVFGVLFRCLKWKRV